MIQQHTQIYPSYTQKQRLEAVQISPGTYRRYRNCANERARRESMIMPEEAEAAVDLILKYPHLGAGKYRATLIDQEQATISTSFLNEGKKQIAEIVEQEYVARKEAEKQLEQELKDRRPSAELYDHVRPMKPHEIWATDFVHINFLSYQLRLCVVYDIYSQDYLSIRVGSGCSAELACDALRHAAQSAPHLPDLTVRRDNGGAFVTHNYQDLLDATEATDAPIPPGTPWYNGSLESGNTTLKRSIKSLAMQQQLEASHAYKHARTTREQAIDLLQDVADQTRQTINHHIARQKFRLPPQQVLEGNVEQQRQRQDRFIERNTRARKQRMRTIRQDPDRQPKNKTFGDKIGSVTKQIVKTLSTDKLYVINEIIRHRFSLIET